MKKLLILLLYVGFVGFCSCSREYWIYYDFYVENRLESDTVTIKIEPCLFIFENLKDSVSVLFPKEKKRIRHLFDNFNEKYPDILLSEHYNLGTIDVYVNDVKLEKNLWERKYWKFTTEFERGPGLFSSKSQRGIYLLIVDDCLFETDCQCETVRIFRDFAKNVCGNHKHQEYSEALECLVNHLKNNRIYDDILMTIDGRFHKNNVGIIHKVDINKVECTPKQSTGTFKFYFTWLGNQLIDYDKSGWIDFDIIVIEIAID